MKYVISILLLSVFFFNCNNRQPSVTQNEVQTDNLGNLISTISFSVKAPSESENEYANDIIPWISIESPENDLENLIEPDKIVLPYNSITLIIDYPLENPITFDLTSDKGFSRKQIILAISEKYHEIYSKEEASASIKTIPIEQREGLINRNQTDGEYGIWGHDLSDLDLNYIEVYKNNKGKIQIILGIES